MIFFSQNPIKSDKFDKELGELEELGSKGSGPGSGPGSGLVLVRALVLAPVLALVLAHARSSIGPGPMFIRFDRFIAKMPFFLTVL